MAISNELRRLVDPNNKCCCEHCLSIKCKEWAEKKGYIIFSKNKECLVYSIDEVYDVIECLNQYEDYFEANTEIEAIIKACNWILEQNK